MTAKEVAAATRADQVLSKLLKHLHYGWPSEIPDDLLPFWKRKEGLTLEGDSIMSGYRVIIPTKLRPRESHPGVVRMN